MTSWLETDSLSNQDISSALAIGTYIAAADKSITVQFFANQVAGSGDYVFYATLQIAGAGAEYVLLPKTTGSAAAGETAIGGQSGIINVRSGDVVKVYLDGLAGDTTTPDTSVRWFELDAAVAGAGATSTTITVNDGSNPIDGVEVWVTTDVGGTNKVASGNTDVLGQVTFSLDPATYYVWKQHGGYNFTNPETMVVT